MSRRLTQAEADQLVALLRTIDYFQGEDGEITAIASDGVRITLGNVLHAPCALLSYLRTHPKPSDW